MGRGERRGEGGQGCTRSHSSLKMKLLRYGMAVSAPSVLTQNVVGVSNAAKVTWA